MLSSIFILDSSGQIIIEKHNRGLISRTVADQFWEIVQKQAPYYNEVPPINQTTKYHLVHIRRSDLFFLGVMPRESSPLMAISFLERTATIFKEYFGGELNESRLKDHFITAYELLDEMTDGGYPFNLEPNILQEMIAVPSVFSSAQSLVMGPGTNISSILPDGSLSQIPWRRSGVKKTTNEIYLDITEEIDGIIECNGALTAAKIVGTISVDCQLSGIPDLLLRLGGINSLDDPSFHPCVRLKRFEQERVVSFVPPDGQFTLMKYFSRGNIMLPLYVKPQILIHENHGTVHVMVGSKHLTGDKPIEDIVVTIPFSSSCSGTTLTSKTGSVTFDDATKVCRWVVRVLPQQSPVLEGTFSFDPNNRPSLPTISVDFCVNMWAASGIKVDSLTVLNEKYNHFKGVKSLTKGGHLQIRLS